MTMIGDKWYRFHSRRYHEGWAGPEDVIGLTEYTVVAETARTVVLVPSKDVLPDGSIGWYGGRAKKRVLKEARRRWAYPTKALALQSLKRRKQMQEALATQELEHARACLAALAVVEGLL